MKVAVEGCCHGELDKIFETIQFLEEKVNVKVDLLLCCGDFQAVRNEGDLKCMAVPPKYRQMQTFYKYYSGEKKAPFLTIFIGGNHEASNHLQELPYGGWVAPNIYYLGYAGIVKFRGVRIGGLSGIFKSHDYRKGHHEYPPYNQQTVRSAYHVRNVEVFKLKQVKQSLDIFMSHDWPRSICHYGNKKQLLVKKKFLQQDVEDNTLGSPAASELLQHLQPTYWFSAHLHVKYAAVMQHQKQKDQEPRTTKFLALDKCLPHRDFLQILDIEHDPNASDHLEYDPEWLAILKATNELINVYPKQWNMPENNGLYAKWDYSANEEAIKEVIKTLGHDLSIPQNFCLTAPCYDPNNPQNSREPVHTINPQTTEFCALLDLTDLNAKVKQLEEEKGYEDLESSEEDSMGSGEERSDYDTSGLSVSLNPDEITLDDEEEEEDDTREDVTEDTSNYSTEQSSNSSFDFSDLRAPPASMVISSDDTSSSNNECGRSVESSFTEEEGRSPDEKSLKRLSNEKRPSLKIKRRNQDIYASRDEDED